MWFALQIFTLTAKQKSFLGRETRLGWKELARYGTSWMQFGMRTQKGSLTTHFCTLWWKCLCVLLWLNRLGEGDGCNHNLDRRDVIHRFEIDGRSICRSLPPCEAWLENRCIPNLEKKDTKCYSIINPYIVKHSEFFSFQEFTASLSGLAIDPSSRVYDGVDDPCHSSLYNSSQAEIGVKHNGKD